jgi:hypothetical protein
MRAFSTARFEADSGGGFAGGLDVTQDRRPASARTAGTKLRPRRPDRGIQGPPTLLQCKAQAETLAEPGGESSIRQRKDALPGLSEGFLEDKGGGGGVLDRRSGAVEDRDLLGGEPARLRCRGELRKLGVDGGPRKNAGLQRVMQLSDAGALPRLSTTTRAAARSAGSSSCLSGLSAPTAATKAPAEMSSFERKAFFEGVQVTMMSLERAAARGSLAASTGIRSSSDIRLAKLFAASASVSHAQALSIFRTRQRDSS